MQRVCLYILTLIIIGAGGFAAGWFFNSNTQNTAALPVLGHVPDFTLTNQLGRQVSSKSFNGKVSVVTFLFPYCRGYCPLIAHNFVSLEQLLKASRIADKVQLISFNVDPESTGPAQMKTFQQQYGWNPEDNHWEYLTGNPEELRRIVTGSYQINYQKVSDDIQDQEVEKAKNEGTYIPEPVVSNKLADEAHAEYDIVHNDALVIVDTTGNIRKIFDSAERVSDQQLIDIIYQLLPANSQKEKH